MLKLYYNIIKEQLSESFIEEIDDNLAVPAEALVHYIPYHDVKKDSITTPIRIVFDCSAKVSKYSPCLKNDCFLTGPPMINELTS